MSLRFFPCVRKSQSQSQRNRVTWCTQIGNLCMLSSHPDDYVNLGWKSVDQFLVNVPPTASLTRSYQSLHGGGFCWHPTESNKWWSDSDLTLSEGKPRAQDLSRQAFALSFLAFWFLLLTHASAAQEHHRLLSVPSERKNLHSKFAQDWKCKFKFGQNEVPNEFGSVSANLGVGTASEQINSDTIKGNTWKMRVSFCCKGRSSDTRYLLTHVVSFLNVLLDSSTYSAHFWLASCRLRSDSSAAEHLWAGVNLDRVGTHSFKKSWVSILMEETQSLAIVSALSGTSMATLSQTYDVPTFRRQQNAQSRAFGALMLQEMVETGGTEESQPSTRDITGQWKFCPFCGCRLRSDGGTANAMFSFCPHCGAKL